MKTTYELEKESKKSERDVPRIDALEKVTGTAIYTGDIEFPNLLHGKILTSPYPHARIVRIDTSRAERMEGVCAVVTGKDMPFLFGDSLVDRAPLAIDKVRFVGEPVAAVAAYSESVAEEAIQQIMVEYEPLPHVLNPIDALKPEAPVIHENLGIYKRESIVSVVPGTNICNKVEHVKGDIERGFSESDFVFEDEFRVPQLAHAALEVHVAVVRVDPDGKITIWSNTDSPYRLQSNLAKGLQLDPSSIRVIVPYLGGGFGGKGGIKLEGIVIALAKKAIGSPVKLELSRDETFASTVTSHGAVVTVKSGVTKDGRLVARHVNVVFDAGAYSEKGPSVLAMACWGGAGPYRIPNVKIEGKLVYTNKIPGDAYRGYGFFQTHFAVESQMDIIAEKLGIDPLEMRLRNILREGDISPVGQAVESCGLEECLTKVAKAIEGETKGKHIGRGMACGYKNTKTPSSSTVLLNFKWDGTLAVLTSLVEEGQGSKHVLAKLASEELGIPLDKIKVMTSDTDITPWDASTTSSRTIFHQGNALLLASRKLIEEIKVRLAHALGHSPESITFADGKFNVDGKVLSFQEASKSALKTGEQIISQGMYQPNVSGALWANPGVFWMYAATGAVVEVDEDTGEVRVRKIVTAQDVGKALDRTLVELQLVGGALQGIGNTVYEELKFNGDGRILNPNFRDYALPSTLDIPDENVPIIVEVPHPLGPKGAKGVGEGMLIPVHAAIANAVYDAIGLRFKDFPITAEKVALELERLERQSPWTPDS